MVNPTPDNLAELNHGERLALLHRIERAVRAANETDADGISVHGEAIDVLARFFAQFQPDDFHKLSLGDVAMVEAWLFYVCRFTEERPGVTLAEHIDDMTRWYLGSADA